MDKLKKCPFCGGEATSYAKQKTHELLKEHGYEVTIFCNDCGAKVVKWCDMQGLAWGAAEGTWSNRKPVEDVLERLEKEENDLFSARKAMSLKMYSDFEMLEKSKMLLEKESTLFKAVEIIKGELL